MELIFRSLLLHGHEENTEPGTPTTKNCPMVSVSLKVTLRVAAGVAGERGEENLHTGTDALELGSQGRL